MDASNIKTILEKQKKFFLLNKTKSFAFRIMQLKKLKKIIQAHEKTILLALKKDLNKSTMEAFTQEVMLIIHEINFIISHLKKWMKPQKVSTPFPLLFPGKSKIYCEPYGSVLIIGPWNYPFQLIMSPLIGAIAAGNCVILKPSELAPNTAEVILKLINEHFDPEYLFAATADPQETQTLLHEKFDYLFFTGGTQIGKIVMEAAAKHLTPVTLELGGKSPCIVDQTANLEYAARRIIWGKMSNAGQVCIAPDYLYVHKSCKKMLIENLINVIKQFYGDNPELSDSFGRIINAKHFERLSKLIEHSSVLLGGKTIAEENYISPTLIDTTHWQDDIMQEEIFGPLLPILTYENIEEVIHAINQQPKSLALYVFTNDKQLEKQIMEQVSFGSGCINDCVMQITNPNLPFGGVGYSGMGQYHGKFSFETFSHRKSIYKKTALIDFSFLYPPYSMKKLAWVRRLLRI